MPCTPLQASKILAIIDLVHMERRSAVVVVVVVVAVVLVIRRIGRNAYEPWVNESRQKGKGKKRWMRFGHQKPATHR